MIKTKAPAPNSKGFVASERRTMKPRLNGTDYMPSTLWSYRKIIGDITRGFRVLFFFAVQKGWFFSCFPSLIRTNALTHKVNLYRELNFGYRQDTKQADHAGQILLSDVNCLFCNKDIWAEKVFSLLFLVLLPLIFLVKPLVSPVSKCYSKSHNDGFL